MHPTKGNITQEYGAFPQASGEPWPHTGTDYAGNIGDEVVTIADGVVVWADWGHKMPVDLANKFAFVPGSDASGIIVIIEHDGWWSVSAHLNLTPLNPGQRVKRGQYVGDIGMTGRSTGAHLHYEVIHKTRVYNSPFGRYNPRLQIDLEDKVSAVKIVYATSKEQLTVSQYEELKSQLDRIEAIVTQNQRDIRATPIRTWHNVFIKRGGKNVNVIQELANNTTTTDALAATALTAADLEKLRGAVRVIVEPVRDDAL